MLSFQRYFQIIQLFDTPIIIALNEKKEARPWDFTIDSPNFIAVSICKQGKCTFASLISREKPTCIKILKPIPVHGNDGKP